jgi:hypothetical protein
MSLVVLFCFSFVSSRGLGIKVVSARRRCNEREATAKLSNSTRRLRQSYGEPRSRVRSQTLSV